MPGAHAVNPDRVDVTVIGSFMKDLVVQAPRRPDPGETVRGTGFAEFLGGKGVNQAVAAARMGASVAMVGRVGQDRYGREFLDLLRAEGIDAAYVRVDPVRGTGIGLPVVQPDGANSIIIVPLANDAVSAADVGFAADRIRRSRVLALQLELPLATAVAALEVASAAGVTTVLNPAPYSVPPDTLAGLADIVVPNEIEAQQLTGRSCDGDGAIAVARQLTRDVARRAGVVTLGERGAVVGTRTATGSIEVTWIEPHPIVPIDTVGAGDAFCGALSAELATGRDLIDAVRTANAAGALATTAPGAVAAIPTALRVRRMLDASPPVAVSEALDV
jgi:ribokinase